MHRVVLCLSSHSRVTNGGSDPFLQHTRCDIGIAHELKAVTTPTPLHSTPVSLTSHDHTEGPSTLCRFITRENIKTETCTGKELVLSRDMTLCDPILASGLLDL